MTLQSRESTGDIDSMMDPEWANDPEIMEPLESTIRTVARELRYPLDWMNRQMSIFIQADKRPDLFEAAKKQSILVYSTEKLQIWAAPIEWALERKLRRVHFADPLRQVKSDLKDAVALLKFLKEREGGLLDEEKIRTYRFVETDPLPDSRTMARVAAAYWEKYGERIFK